MGILKLAPATKDYLWGGTRLITQFGKHAPPPLAESWEVSCHPDGPSRIVGGPGAGLVLPDYLQAAGEAALGRHCHGLPEFPLLVKLIDAKQALSVQVHPPDDYAFAHEGQQGKTEMWYIIDSAPGAFLYIGFRRPVTQDEVKTAIAQNTLTELLQPVPVRPGDAFLIRAGTVHAIGAGILLAEVQQSSNVTYRLYDYGRLDAGGQPRPLHVEQALRVMRLAPEDATPPARYHLTDTDYFTVDKATVIGQISGATGADSFTALLMYGGAGVLYGGRQAFSFQQGQSFFIEADTGPWSIMGNCACLAVTVPAALRRRLDRFMQPAALA